jgi:hypothetical protein
MALPAIIVACGGAGIDPADLAIVPPEQVSIESIAGESVFEATAIIDSTEGTFTVQISRDGDVTRSTIDSNNPAAPNATLVARGAETYALGEGGWVRVDDFGAAGLLLLLAAPDVAYQMAAELWEAGTFVGWEEWEGRRVARFDVAEIPVSVRAEFYTTTGGEGSVWLTEDGVPLRWSARHPDGVTGSLDWMVTSLGGPVEIELPPQLGG